MRFVSKHRKYIYGIQSDVEMVLANGKSQVITPRIVAEFQHADVLDHERAVARASFDFRGTQTEMDEVTPVDPANRLSAYDTDGEWNVRQYSLTDQQQGLEPGTTKKMVEEALLAGTISGFHIHVPAPELAPPWPTYDGMKNPKAIASRVRELGFDPDDVVAYEIRHQNRAEVVEALHALSSLVEEDAELVEA